MKRTAIILFSFLCIAGYSFCQPQTAWIHTFDAGQHEVFWDIYRVPDDGYIMCGFTNNSCCHCNDGIYTTYVVRIDENGEEMWSGLFNLRDGLSYGRTVVETDSGDFVIGGYSNGRVSCLMLDPEGEQEWYEEYALGECWAIIELKSGEFLLSGRYRDPDDENWASDGYIAMIEYNGDLIWERVYDMGCQGAFKSIREVDGGVIVVGDGRTEFQDPWHLWVLKINPEEEGEIIWDDHIYEENGIIYSTSVATNPRGGFALTGWRNILVPAPPTNCQTCLFRFDDDGRVINNSYLDYIYNGSYDNANCIATINEGFVIVGWYNGPRLAIGRPFAIRTNPDGVERWRALYDFRDLPGFANAGGTFQSVVVAEDETIVAAGNQGMDSTGSDGLVVKLSQDILRPQFIMYSPEDTLFTTLIGDTVEFWVRASDAQNDHLRYTWTVMGDTVDYDTSATVIFDSLGVIDVTCEVTDEEFYAHITWHVNVVDFYIAGYDPDSLVIEVLRGDSLDFRLDARGGEDVDLEYLWLHSDAEDQHDMGELDSTRVIFDLSGNHRVQGIVSHGENSRSITWEIATTGFQIRSYEPDTLSLRVRRNSSIDFSLVVERLEGVEEEYQWLLYGRDIERGLGGDPFASVLFDQAGEFTVEAYVVFEGQDDAILWNVEVISSIWSWYPVETGMRVPVDTTLFFHLEAYNPQSDSLSYRWLLDNNPIDVDSSAAELFIEFPETCNCEVLGIVNDGTLADTVCWEIEVFDPTGVTSRSSLIPEDVSLSPPIPNPFNAVARVEFGLPTSAHVSLKVFDLNGRIVSELTDRELGAGYHSASFDATDIPAGMYLVRLDTGRETLTRKAVVIK